MKNIKLSCCIMILFSLTFLTTGSYSQVTGGDHVGPGAAPDMAAVAAAAAKLQNTALQKLTQAKDLVRVNRARQFFALLQQAQQHYDRGANNIKTGAWAAGHSELSACISKSDQIIAALQGGAPQQVQPQPPAVQPPSYPEMQTLMNQINNAQNLANRKRAAQFNPRIQGVRGKHSQIERMSRRNPQGARDTYNQALAEINQIINELNAIPDAPVSQPMVNASGASDVAQTQNVVATLVKNVNGQTIRSRERVTYVFQVPFSGISRAKLFINGRAHGNINVVINVNGRKIFSGAYGQNQFDLPADAIRGQTNVKISITRPKEHRNASLRLNNIMLQLWTR